MPSSACRALTLGILAALSVTAKPLPVLTPVTAAAADRGFIASLPLAFEANEGQFAETIRYAARGAGHAFAFSADGARVALAGGVGAFSMRFEHANRTSPVGEWPLPGTANYFLGADPEAWRTDVPTYRRVRYPEVYPGIDAVFYGNGRQLEYDLIVEPGGDPRQPRLSFSGVDEVRLSAEGELELAVRERTLRFTRPVAYQVIDGRRQPVAAAYRLEPDGIRFEVGPYDRRRVLTIDPVFVYSTYLGGSGEDMIFDVAADPAGSVYVTGHTFSTDFPVTSSALQSSKAPGVLAFVSKITGPARR
jgi:hypothetical protein